MIRLHLCTISFRHQLVSLPELATWAAGTGFDGIELWGVHARHLADQPRYDADWVRARSLEIPMISDYLPLEGNESRALDHTLRLCAQARHWGAGKIRTFAGHQASAGLSATERRELARRLRTLTRCVADHGLTLVVETHPNTLADTVSATAELLTEVDHPALGLNYDVLHIWESGADPLVALRQLMPWVRHFHFKNIEKRSQLGVFAPANVYSPAGCREGMVPVLEGACDYRPIIDFVAGQPDVRDVSLEWFGHDSHRILRDDLNRLQALVGLARTKAQASLACH